MLQEGSGRDSAAGREGGEVGSELRGREGVGGREEGLEGG